MKWKQIVILTLTQHQLHARLRLPGSGSKVFKQIWPENGISNILSHQVHLKLIKMNSRDALIVMNYERKNPKDIL